MLRVQFILNLVSLVARLSVENKNGVIMTEDWNHRNSVYQIVT